MHVGDTIAARFQLEEQVGAGTFGSVFRAHDRTTHETVAVKVLHLADLESSRRFNREARVLASLEHPHIVRYVSHGTTPSGESYLAMEWLDGETLQARLARGPLARDEVVPFARAVTDALACAHAGGIVHRDLKPANLLLPDGDPRRVKLLDFGIARWTDASLAMTRTGVALGTPLFMAPEQAFDAADVDARTDLFALGAVLVSAVRGQHAFSGADPLSVMIRVALAAPAGLEACGDVAPGFDALVTTLLAKRPNERPTGADAVLDMLDALANGSQRVPTPRDGAAGRMPPGMIVAIHAVVPIGHGPALPPTVETLPERTLPVNAAGVPQAASIHRSDQVAAEIARCAGARVAALADGTLAVAVDSYDSNRALEVAFTVARLCPTTVVALAVGNHGSVIDRSCSLARSVPPSGLEAGAFCTDPESEQRLAPRWGVRASGAVRWIAPPGDAA